MARRRQWTGAHERRGHRAAEPGWKPKDLMLVSATVADALRADGWWLRSVIVWDKMVATEPPRRDRPSSSHEYLFLLSAGADSRVRDPGEPWYRSTVWTLRPQPSPVDHPALMPPELVRRCLVASGAPGLVVDPFAGAGTTGLVADRLGWDSVLIELQPGYAELARARIRDDASLLAQVS